MPDEKPFSGEIPPPEPLSGDPQGEAGAPPLGFIGDVVRKAVLTGVGALFLTEEGARKLAREWKLPKELASYLVSQAAGAKFRAVEEAERRRANALPEQWDPPSRAEVRARRWRRGSGFRRSPQRATGSS